jgi:hypothetical protein
VPGLTATAAGSAWSYGGSILTFVFPMLLFLIVGAVLWVLFTKPQVVPGHRNGTAMRSVGSTWLVRSSGEIGPAGGAAPLATAGGAAPSEGGETSTAEGEGR